MGLELLLLLLALAGVRSLREGQPLISGAKRGMKSSSDEKREVSEFGQEDDMTCILSRAGANFI